MLPWSVASGDPPLSWVDGAGDRREGASVGNGERGQGYGRCQRNDARDHDQASRLEEATPPHREGRRRGSSGQDNADSDLERRVEAQPEAAGQPGSGGRLEDAVRLPIRPSLADRYAATAAMANPMHVNVSGSTTSGGKDWPRGAGSPPPTTRDRR